MFCFCFSNKSDINKLVVLLASCIAQVPSLYITSCMHFCLCESFWCKQGGEEKKQPTASEFCTQIVEYVTGPQTGAPVKEANLVRAVLRQPALHIITVMFFCFFFNEPPRLWGTGSLGEIKINKLSGWLQVKTQQNIGA